MKVTKKALGATVATAAAAMFIAGTAMTTVPTTAHAASVQCVGINSCKGTSECATANNACKGQNACAGQGWVSAASADECTGKGGTVLES